MSDKLRLMSLGDSKLADMVLSLESQVAELQAKLEFSDRALRASESNLATVCNQRDKWEDCAKAAEAKLDEMAKQEPIPRETIMQWFIHVPNEKDWPKIYAHPVNTPALIEQAVREENQRCESIARDMFHAAATGDEIADAIRALINKPDANEHEFEIGTGLDLPG